MKGDQFNPITGLDPAIANSNDVKPASRNSNINQTRLDQEKRAAKQSPWNVDPQELPPPVASGKRTTFADER